MKEGRQIDILPNPLRNNELYTLHTVVRDGKQYYGKVFYDSKLNEHDLIESIQFNSEVFENASDYIYPDNFLTIDKVYPHKQGFILLTEKYEARLDQYIDQVKLTEKQAIEIMEQILKAVYSLSMTGYWTRNLRAQHFVLVKKKWKLQSLVYSHQLYNQGFSSEYLFNKMHQVPELYHRTQFSDEEMDQWIVWDLGCIFIHLLLGTHKLKSEAILKQFQNQPFSFQKLKAMAAQKFSPQTKQILGKMCHYQPQKRLTLSSLVKSGYFSKQVQADYVKNEGKQQKKIFLSGSSSVSQMITVKTFNPNSQLVSDTTQIANQKKKQEEQIKRTISPSHTQILENDVKFSQKISDILEIVEEDFSFKAKQSDDKIKKMKSQQFPKILSLFKNYFDKCQLINIGSNIFKKIVKKVSSVQQSRDLLDLTEYSLSFLSSMEYSRLANSMNKNERCFQINEEDQERFLGSNEHLTIKRIVNQLSQENLAKTAQIRERIRASNNKIVNSNQFVKKFVNQLSPSMCTFNQIKIPYRFVIKKSYDLIVDFYSTHKTDEWASVGMYITFCMAIDKLYIPGQFEDNFKFFFEWAKIAPCSHVELDQFQKYLHEAPRATLVKNSRYIVEKFYQL